MRSLGTVSVRAVVLVTLLTSTCLVRAFAAEATLQELKDRFRSASVRERPRIGLEIAELQMKEAEKLYSSAEDQNGQAALEDVVTYSELARDYAIQSHKYEKQSEIAVRGLTRRLTDMMHTLPQIEQEPLQKAIGRLQRVRDDLLSAMFAKGNK